VNQKSPLKRETGECDGPGGTSRLHNRTTNLARSRKSWSPVWLFSGGETKMESRKKTAERERKGRSAARLFGRTLAPRLGSRPWRQQPWREQGECEDSGREPGSSDEKRTGKKAELQMLRRFRERANRRSETNSRYNIVEREESARRRTASMSELNEVKGAKAGPKRDRGRKENKQKRLMLRATRHMS